MSGWELATWASIGVLVFGSAAVFAWFAIDVRTWLRDPSRTSRQTPPEGHD